MIKHRQTKAGQAEPLPGIATRLTVIALFVLLIRDCFGGALVYYLDGAHLMGLWVVPDLLMVVAIVLNSAKMLSTSVAGGRTLVLGGVIYALPVLVGVLEGNTWIGIFASAKIFLPLLALLTNSDVAGRFVKHRWLFYALFLASCGFVIINQFVQYPWVGYSVEKFGVTREASRLWWSGGGTTRLSGATGGSFLAGTVIAFLLTMMVVKKRPRFYDLIFWAIGIYCEYLCTFKAGLLCLALLPIFVPGQTNHGFRKVNIYTLRSISFLIFYVASCIMPWMIGFNSGKSFAAKGTSDFSSFYDRIFNTWPGVFYYLKSQFTAWSYFFGAGYGSFGTPSQYSDIYILAISDTDNAFLYLYVNYGIFAFALLIWSILSILRKRQDYLLCIFVYSCIGFSTGLEGCSLLMLLGIGLTSTEQGARSIVRNSTKRTAADRRSTLMPQFAGHSPPALEGGRPG